MPDFNPPEVLDHLCPLNLRLDAAGQIVHLGPTLSKMGLEALMGETFDNVFAIERPGTITTFEHLASQSSTRAHLKLRKSPRIEFKAAVVPSGDETIVTLSFGTGTRAAVEKFDLSASDFAATDLTSELLYVLEAKSAVVAESRNLNRRLDAARKAAEQIAQTDALTGLQNRRAMTQYLDQLITSRLPFACMHMDLDYFKRINDTFGHAAGDYVLRAVAQVLNSETRAEDCVARIGGDEFVLIFVRVTDPVFLQRIAQRMITKLEEPMQFDQHVCCISASAGTSISIDYPNPDPDVMLSDADRALYASKKAGRGQHRFAKDHQSELSKH